MTKRASVCVAMTALAVSMAAPCSARAQSAPPTPRVSPPPPAPVAAIPAVTPPDSAVALCMDGSWVKEPRTASDCAARGGLKVTMPPKPQAPPTPGAANQSVIALQPALLRSAPPAGATMQCKDGTYLFGAPSESRCAQNGGVTVTYPAAAPPPPPRRP